jgi:membrane-anchored glycerophosphoryl diester phosphodiesterase (GDPDase)
MAFKILRKAFQDVWQELWTILIVQLLFLLGHLLIVFGPPVTVAMFYYGNRIVHDEVATEREFLHAVRQYWKPAWRWGGLNFLVIGLLAGDYYLTGKWVSVSNLASLLQGFYIVALILWLLLQMFALPFLFEQERPSVVQALRNSTVFVTKNLFFVLVLAFLLAISLALGTLAFMLTFVFGTALISFTGNHAVLDALKTS